VIHKLGSIIRFHRRKARLTQSELAALAGVGKTVVFDIEKGKGTVRIDTLTKVLQALNIQIDWTSQLKEAFFEEERKGQKR
jgi:y4mF family transcriptional regulator